MTRSDRNAASDAGRADDDEVESYSLTSGVRTGRPARASAGKARVSNQRGNPTGLSREGNRAGKLAKDPVAKSSKRGNPGEARREEPEGRPGKPGRAPSGETRQDSIGRGVERGDSQRALSGRESSGETRENLDLKNRKLDWGDSVEQRP